MGPEGPAGPAGPQGPAGAVFDLQGPSGLSLYVADSNGIYFMASANNGSVTGGIVQAYQTGFLTDQCDGDEYIPADQRPSPSFSIQTQSFLGPPSYSRVLASEVVQTVPIYSMQSQGGPPQCTLIGPMPVVKLTPITAPSDALFVGPATPTAT